MLAYTHITKTLKIAFAVWFFALASAQGGTFGYLEYKHYQSWEYPSGLKVSITGWNGAPTDLVVPYTIADPEHGELEVKRIDDAAFKGCTSLKSISLPEGLSDIYANAFKGCTNLSSITLPSSVKFIYSNAFEGCSSLKSISLPEGLFYIADATFKGCARLSSITLPSSVRSIYLNAFEGCVNLKSVNLPDGISDIGYAAFKGCANLSSITLPSSVQYINSSAFEGCTNLASINLPDGLSYISDSTFKGCANLSSITLPNSVQSVSSSAFEGCTNLVSINLPEGISYIGWRAFKGCAGLASITLPSSVSVIYSNAFEGCTSLKSINLPKGLSHINYQAFKGCTSLTQITLPDETITIGWEIFQGCDNLATITLGAYFEGIGYFDDYNGEHDVEDSEALAENLNELPKLANINVSASNENFESVDGVLYNKGKSELIAFPAARTGSFVIPAHVKTIGESAFSNSKLISITISDTVTFIGEDAFEGASQLQSISIPDKFATELGGLRLPVFLAYEALVKAVANKIASGTNNYGLSIKSDLDFYTTKTDAANYATKSDISNFTLKNELPQAVEKVLADIDASLGPVPVITSDLATLALTRGKAMTYSTTTNFSATAFSAVGLPSGLSINPVTGVISGKPYKKGTFSTFIYAGIPGGATTTSVKVFIVN